MTDTTLKTPIGMWFDPETMMLMGPWPYLSGQKLTRAGFNAIVARGGVVDAPYTLGQDFLCLELPSAPEELWRGFVMVGIAPDLEVALVAQGAS